MTDPVTVTEKEAVGGSGHLGAELHIGECAVSLCLPLQRLERRRTAFFLDSGPVCDDPAFGDRDLSFLRQQKVDQQLRGCRTLGLLHHPHAAG